MFAFLTFMMREELAKLPLALCTAHTCSLVVCPVTCVNLSI